MQGARARGDGVRVLGAGGEDGGLEGGAGAGEGRGIG